MAGREDRVLRLASFSLPGVRVSRCWSTTCWSEAARLFVERAQATQPSFAVTEQNLVALVRSVSAWTRIPIALEPAGGPRASVDEEWSRSRVATRRPLSPADRKVVPRYLASELTAPSSTGLRPAPEAERTALNQLSVFADCTGPSTAEAVTIADTLDLLARLVDKVAGGLEKGEEKGESANRLLETIRR